MAQTDKYKIVETFINPAGFVEQHYRGIQTLESVLSGLKELELHVNKFVKEQGRSALILEDVSELSKVDLSRRMARARAAAVKLMRELNYDRAAIYGPLVVQLLVNTLALIAGKKDKIRVFRNRDDALEWLKSTK